MSQRDPLRLLRKNTEYRETLGNTKEDTDTDAYNKI